MSNSLHKESRSNIRNLVLLGLGGVGKSLALTQMVEYEIKQGNLRQYEFLILTFDKRLSKSYLNKSHYFNKNNVKTVHSLCYSVLRDMGLLPLQFAGMNEEEHSKDLKSKDYDELISLFLGLRDDDIAGLTRGKMLNTTFSEMKLILADEIQDFREDYMAVIKKLKRVGNSTGVIIAGDRHQRIYGFQDKHGKFPLSNVINEPSSLYGDESYEVQYLTTNHRVKNPEILKFINEFVVNTSGTEKEYLYDLSVGEKSKWKRKPIVYYFTNMKEEQTYIEKEIESVSEGFSIGILGRSKKDIEKYEKVYRENPRVSVSTVHTMKGDEKDYIFYVGFHYDVESDPEITTICYTAISRASKRLFITSSYPMGNEKKVFTDDTYEFHSTQRDLSKPFLIRNKIEKNKNLTWNKIKDNYIDSLELKVKVKDCPFLPYIKKEGTTQYRYQSILRTVSDYWMEYSISLHHSAKAYYFKFKDLNLLKRNGFSDTKVIQACINELLQFYDNRVRIEDIMVNRVDLCRFIRFDREEDIEKGIIPLIEKMIEEGRYSSILNERKREIGNASDLYHYFSLLHDTLYVNHHKDRYSSITSCLYYPKNKENENRIHIDELYKIEMRARGSFLDRKMALDGDRRVLNLLDKSERGELEDLFYNWVSYYHGEEIEENMKKLGVS